MHILILDINCPLHYRLCIWIMVTHSEQYRYANTSYSEMWYLSLWNLASLMDSVIFSCTEEAVQKLMNDICLSLENYTSILVREVFCTLLPAFCPLLLLWKTTITAVQVPRTVKVRAIPLQAWTGPEGSRRLRLQDFKTIGTWRW